MAYSRRRASLKHHNRRHLLRGCEALEPRQLLATIVTPTNGSNPYFTDIVLVRFKPDTTDAEVNALVSTVGGTITRSYGGDLAGLKQVTLDPARQTASGVQNAIEAFKASGEVKYAERNLVRQFTGIPNDPLFRQQYGLHNTGQTVGTVDADIDAPEAWDIVTGTKDVVIAIIDSGTDPLHPDLVPNHWKNPGEIAGNNIDEDLNGYIDDDFGYDFFDGDAVPEDLVPHGTHVAGIIGAKGNNNEGVSGVNWDVSLMHLKIGDDTGLSAAAIVEAINYTTIMKADYGINIVASNNSYGGGAFSAAERDAIIASERAGILYIAAAGNSSEDSDAIPAYPAGYQLPNVITVAATDRNDRLAGFSNYGLTTVDLGAPGVNIMSTMPFDLVPSRYEAISGTSMASPMVAGAAGLIAAAQPGLTYQQIRDLILDNVDKVPSLDNKVITGGRLNVNNAINKLGRSSVEGTVYADKAGDGVIQAGDTPLSNIIVWYDVDNDGALDAGEPQTISDSTGHWVINRLQGARSTSITIRVAPPPNVQVTVPNDGTGAYRVTFDFNGQAITGLDFGLYGPPGEIRGFKWLDNNGNASLDPSQGDGPMQGVYIYVDIDGDGRAGIGEPAAISDANGAFVIRNVPIGTYFLREVLQPGQSTAFPASGAYQFTMTPNGVLTGFNFFNSPAHDYGDAPDSYRTLAASGGPVHGFVAGYGLGSKIDAEGNGQPTSGASGDDANFSDDEDGVTFLNTPTPGQRFNFTVNVRVPQFTSNGYLNAWMDFNRDGDFADASEKIIGGRQLGSGNHSFSINVPAGASLGTSYVRFRYGREANIGFGGRAVAGEVEDYAVSVLGALPLARDDRATVQQFSKNNVIDVLANDVRSAAGDIRIDPNSFPATSARGGKLVLVTNGTADPSDDFVRYDAARAPAGTLPTYSDSFVYTITDGTNQDSATVRITINRVSTPPTAVDDTVTANSSGTTTIFPAMYLGNDIPGTDRGRPYSEVALHSFTTAVKDDGGATIGTVSRNTNGTPNDSTDDRLIFTPAAGAAGKTGQFSYTARNPDPTNPPVGDTATITVQVKGSTNSIDANDIVKLSIEVRDTASGGGVATTSPTQLVQGQKYWVGIFADDLRSFFEDESGQTANGALSVYLDLLFDNDYVSPVRVTPTTRNPAGVNIRYGEKYATGSTGFSGDAGTGGVLDELGVTSGEEVLGTGNLPVLYVQFVAKNATPGTSGVVLWRTDPADQRNAIDESFSHDVTVVNRADPTKLQDLFITNIAYWQSRSFRIIGPTLSSATLASTTTTSSTTTRTPTAPQEPVYSTSTATKTSTLDAAMAALFADEGSPYKKR